VTTARRLRWAAAAAAVLFAVLLLVVLTSDWVARTDHRVESRAIRFYFEHLQFARWMQRITKFGDPLRLAPVVVGGAVAFALRRRWREAAFLALVPATGGLLNRLAKLLIGRHRPDSMAGLPSFHGNGFPSGHAMGATVVFGALLLVLWPFMNRWTRVVASAAVIAIVAAVSVSRVYLGAHWPTDVAGGVLLGTAWVAGWGAVLVSGRDREGTE
jgi:undecaprenyl-diphosphatase